VWATLEEIDVARLPRKPDHYVPPLGYPLEGTDLALMDDTGSLVLLAPVLAQRRMKRQTQSGSAQVTRTMTGNIHAHINLVGQLLIGGSRWCRLDDETAPQQWRETGDLVRVVNGKVYFICRAQDYVIKVTGKKINLLEVSNVLQSCPGVRDIT
jgi:acyl-CoA synthetase (AMP-forming)/AMP-acid ligase II